MGGFAAPTARIHFSPVLMSRIRSVELSTIGFSGDTRTAAAKKNDRKNAQEN
jgi:hypothetical protein